MIKEVLWNIRYFCYIMEGKTWKNKINWDIAINMTSCLWRSSKLIHIVALKLCSYSFVPLLDCAPLCCTAIFPIPLFLSLYLHCCCCYCYGLLLLTSCYAVALIPPHLVPARFTQLLLLRQQQERLSYPYAEPSALVLVILCLTGCPFYF